MSFAPRAAAVTLAAVLLASAPLVAQSAESENAPARCEFEPASVPAAGREDHRPRAVVHAQRLSTVDLDDGAAAGGSFDEIFLGFNWWATRLWKAGAGWGRTWLDKFDAEGRTDAVLLRAHWLS